MRLTLSGGCSVGTRRRVFQSALRGFRRSCLPVVQLIGIKKHCICVFAVYQEVDRDITVGVKLILLCTFPHKFLLSVSVTTLI